eukprot:SAG31_NODE_535_length_14348_cov_11.339603_10_plen_197_part_00
MCIVGYNVPESTIANTMARFTCVLQRYDNFFEALRGEESPSPVVLLADGDISFGSSSEGGAHSLIMALNSSTADDVPAARLSTSSIIVMHIIVSQKQADKAAAYGLTQGTTSLENTTLNAILMINPKMAIFARTRSASKDVSNFFCALDLLDGSLPNSGDCTQHAQCFSSRSKAESGPAFGATFGPEDSPAQTRRE